MGENNEEMYIQGFSTSLPTDVQRQMLRSLDGFENAEIMRYAYAIEYDCANPLGMLSTLEFKEISGLYGAGQFNTLCNTANPLGLLFVEGASFGLAGTATLAVLTLGAIFLSARRCRRLTARMRHPEHTGPDSSAQEPADN